MPRLELAGSSAVPDPLVLTFTANGTFIPQTYIDQGYTNFDVIVIGGGGGNGGGVDTNNTGTLVRSYGGGGGGGGLHRVKGLLKYLTASVAVTVGAGGAGGTNGPTSGGGGQTGGTSQFGTTAKATGGGGGNGVITNSLTADPQGWGGAGGCGGFSGASGASGGRTAAGNSTTVPQGPDGIDGVYISGIGQGGGGGGGGMAKYDGTLYLLASAGGRGSYNLTDTSVFGPGSQEGVGLVTGVVPGGGGGAKASPVNGLPTVYGNAVTTPSGTSAPAAGRPGIVVVRLTAE